jgi:Tfp pilus assembly protein PilV
MALRRGSRTARPEAGFALIEVVVSALIAVTVTGGVIKLLNSTARAGAEERHRSQAYSVAQDDQARMRGLPIPTLNNYERTETVTVGGTPYTIHSTGSFVNDRTAALSCSSGSGSADYVQISSEVTWPTLKRAVLDPVLIESIVTPPSGSLDPTHGTLTVLAVNATETPISNVGVAGRGPSTFTGSTDATGCAIFPDIPEGNYTVTPTLAADFVDKDGAAPKAETVGVVGNSTVTKKLMYDKEGSISVNFKVRGYNGVDQASKADRIVYFNNQMTVPEKSMGTLGGTENSSYTIQPLFPFTTGYSIYAGCSGNDPEALNEAKTSVRAPSGSSAVTTLRLPALYVNVWTGRNSSNKGTAFNNADVWIKDDNCSVTRRYPTTSSGQLADPGFPWSQYDVCADTLTSSTGTGRRQRIENVSVESLSTGTTLNFYLGSGTGTVSSEGNCP